MKYPLKQGLRWCMLSMAVTASAQVSAPIASTQLPTGGKVMSGTTSIQSVGNVLNINQSSQRSAINWNTFNVGSGAKVNFIQPSASSVTLNRVLDTNGSQILGSINANGQVFISNPNGVLFGPNSQVNVGGLIATTQNITVDDFMAGKSTFEGTGTAGSVVNQGTLEAALGGYIALLAPSVRNEGVVLAREGTVAFAAGDKTVVQFNGPQLVSVMVDRSVLDALVENKQIVRADGGLVIFSARSANAVLSSVIRNTGTVQANTIVNRQGRIMLEGGSQGVVEMGGTLQASGVDAGTQGGTMSATGDKVSVVSGALLDATGQSGGGNVLVGGSWQGSDPTIQSANAVNIAPGAVLNASAIQNGKGGTVVAWSDTQNSAGVTKVQGTLLARGGVEGGNGGRIETSGRWISTSGASGDASAIKGTGGQWLFDPYDVDIVATPSTTNQATNSSNTWSPIGNGSTILNSDITNLLNAGTSVTVLVPTTGGGGLSGNIKVSAPIIQQAASPSANLTLSAYRNLLIDQPITLSGSTGTLQLTAGTGSSAQGYISIDNAISANTVSVDNFASGPVTQSVAISANNLRINAPLSNVTLNDTSNQIGALAANVQSLSIKTSQGVDKGSLYGSGMAIGIVGDLTGVTAAGDISMSVLNGNLFADKSISTASTSSTALKLNAGSSLTTGSYSGTNSINNPYGPNIILASDFSSTNQSINVGSGGKGLLYTGGYGNSGTSLATYLGANKSRYNSNESTTNFSTAIGTELTAIYRQNPSMVVTGPSASTTYGTNATFGTNSISGLANSDTSAGMTVGTYSYTSSLSTSGNQKAGSYSVVPTGASNGLGYGISYVNGSYSVEPKPLNTSVTKTYDGNTTFATGFTLAGTVSGDATPTVTGGSTTVALKNANTYSAFAGNTLTLSDSNYSLTGGSVTAVINKANAAVIGLSALTKFDGFTKTLTGFTATGLVNGETTGDIVKSASNINGLSASVSGRFSGTYLNTPYGTANNYNLNFVSGQLLITGCPGGPPCSAIGPQTTASNITPIVIPAMTAPSLSSAVVSTVVTTTSAAPVLTFASSSGGSSFGTGGGSTTIANNSTTINAVTTTNLISSGNTTTNTSPTPSTTTTTIVNTGANSTNPATNVINIATNTPSGSPTPSQINIAQGSTSLSASPNTVTTTAPSPTSPVTASATPNNTTTPTATPRTTTNVNTLNATNNATAQTATPANQAPTNTASTPTNNTVIPQPATGVVVANNNPNATQVNVAAAQPNVVNPQRLADILSKKDPVEISSALPPTQVAQLSPEQVAPLIDSLSMRQLMSLTNEQIAKFEPARQAELLNIIKVLKDNPEKAAEKAFTPTDKTFAQLAANGLLKEQIDTLSTRVTQINQNITTVNIDTPQKLAELLTKKDPVEIATALPSNQVAQLTPEQAAPLISSLTVRQLLALTNEQISKFDTARQAELLNIINVIKNNPEKAADKAYTAIDKTTAQYVANGLMKDQIDALASKVTQITQNKTTINIDTPQKLAEILSRNNAVEVAMALPSNVVPQLTSDQVAPLINALSVKQLLSLTNEQMSKLDPARLAELLNIIKGLKDTPEKAIDKTYTPEDKAVAQYAANGLLKDPIERLSLRANYIANNKSVDPLNKELADLTNPPVPANVPVARNAPNQANRPLNAAQLAAQNANRETPNLTPAQVAALNPKDLGPLLSQLNANQLMAITNAQMASLEGSYLNQLTILLNFVQDRASNPVANATPAAGGNRVNNTNIFINQPVAKLAGAALLADQPNAALPTAPIPTPNPVLAGVGLTPKQVSELDPTQLAALINQLNANQLMAITNAQMARMDGRALNQLTILMNFVQQRTANNNGTANGNNPANAGTNTSTNINVFVNQPVSRLASNALLNEQPKPNAPVGAQSFTQTNITINLTPRQISELDPTQLAPLISQLNANQLMAITNTQMARMDSQSINQLNILMNFVQQRALNSNTNTTIYINQPVSQIAAASLMNDQPLPTQIAGAAPAPIATVPLSPLQIAGLTPSQVAPLLNRMNSRQLMAVTDTQMASLDSANLNQLITLLNFIQDSARTSPIVTNNFANRPVAGFLPPELNTSQRVTQP